MRTPIVTTAFLLLAACGGGTRVSGTIGEACIDANRSAATPALCSCVQQVANQTLSGSDQRRAAAFFSEPQLAQDTRQSDSWSDEAFWDRYKAFAARAEQICRPLA